MEQRKYFSLLVLLTVILCVIAMTMTSVGRTNDSYGLVDFFNLFIRLFILTSLKEEAQGKKEN